MVSNEVGTIKTDIVKMSSNKKRAATWMNNALDEHSKENPTIGKTLFCQKLSLKRILGFIQTFLDNCLPVNFFKKK